MVKARGCRVHVLIVLIAATAFVTSGCGGGGGSSSLALGERASVQTAKSGSPEGTPTTTLGVTVLAVRAGTQEELEEGGFSLDPDEKELKPYYVDVRYGNEGQVPIERSFGVGLRDQDDTLISEVAIISLGGPPFEHCPRIREGTLQPGDSYESCSLFLIPEDSEPDRVHFLPYVPGEETDFVYWDAAGADEAE